MQIHLLKHYVASMINELKTKVILTYRISTSAISWLALNLYAQAAKTDTYSNHRIILACYQAVGIWNRDHDRWSKSRSLLDVCESVMAPTACSKTRETRHAMTSIIVSMCENGTCVGKELSKTQKKSGVAMRNDTARVSVVKCQITSSCPPLTPSPTTIDQTAPTPG